MLHSVEMKGIFRKTIVQEAREQSLIGKSPRKDEINRVLDKQDKQYSEEIYISDGEF